MTTTTPHVGIGNLVNALGQLAAPLGIAARPPSLARQRYRSESSRGTAPLADVYLPDGDGPHPSMVLVHGGGFVIGSRRMKAMRYLSTRLCNAGFAVATFDYRLLYRGGDLTTAVADVREMLRWWHGQSERFALDNGRISVGGLSAGATLTLLATAEPPLPLHRVVSVFALYDLSGIRGRLPRLMARKLTGSREPAEWQQRSPSHREMGATPLVMLHGTADDLTPLADAHAYRARRQAAGLPTQLHIYEGAPHGFFNDARKPVADQAFQDLLAALVD